VIKLKIQESFVPLLAYTEPVPEATSVSINRHPFAYQSVVFAGTVVPVAITASPEASLRRTVSVADTFSNGKAIV
jgi:hypothetical protein